MSNSNRNHRHALVAFSLVLLSILALAIIGSANKPPGYQEAYAASDNVQSSSDSHLPAEVTAIVAALREFNPWDDTFAQWIMAIATIVATGVSFWAVWMVRATLVATQEAIKTAREANDIMVAQMRPWLVIEREVMCDFYLSENTCGLAWRFRIKNTAQTPAMSTVISDELVFFESLHEFMVAFRRFVDRCRDKSTTYTGTPIFRDSEGDGKSWSRLSSQVPRQTMFHGVFVCMTYRFRDQTGIDAQAFIIEEPKTGCIGPMTHKLISYERLRVIE